MPVTEALFHPPAGALLSQRLVLANSLKWLAPEIDLSLQRIRALIEQQQEADEGELDTTTVIAEIKLVVGALHMASCHGGALLADEIRATLEIVAEGKLAHPGAALAAVSGATLQLSDYLDALRHSVPDRAAVLQPAVSELRLASGRVAATEADLFVRQMLLIDARLPVPQDNLQIVSAAGVAAKLLPAFQSLLLQWLKGVDVANALLRLRKVGDHVATHAKRSETLLLWSAFAAAIDSLVASPGVESLELKRWVGRLGQQIKILVDQGEDAAAALAPEIAWRLLAHAAPINHSGSRWLMLRHYLPLDATLPIESALVAARQLLRGPNTRLLEKVADEVRADLAVVKDGLDLALRAGGLSPDAQASTGERIDRIANTLVLLGLPQLEQVLRSQSGQLATLGVGGIDNQGDWMRIATALLRVEHSLETALFRPLRQIRNEPLKELPGELIETVPHSQDLRESVAALLREMLVDLAKLKALLDAYLKGNELRDPVEPLQLLSEVASGLVMLDRLPAAGFTSELRDWLQAAGPQELRGDPALAVRFAESVAALELYLEALRDALPQPERMLETLMVALAALSPSIKSGAASSLDALVSEMERSSTAPLQPEPEPESVAEATPLSEVPATEAPSTLIADGPAEPPLARAHFLASGRAPEMIEREVIDLFRTDALDRLADIERWLHNGSEGFIDADIVRALHTIKGSAAVVNAEPLSHLAGALESVLKQFAEADTPVPPEVRAVLAEALPVLGTWTWQAGHAAPLESAADWLARVEALKSFLPPPGETRSFARRETLVNLAFDRLQVVEQRLVAWAASPLEVPLGRAMADAAEALAEVSGECAPLARGAAAMTQRLRAGDLDVQLPQAVFFTALASVLERFYQFLDIYREGGIRDSGRELAELLLRLPLTTELPQAAMQSADAPVDVGTLTVTPDPSQAEVAMLDEAVPQTFEGEFAEPPQSLELHVIPHALPMPPETVDDELALLFAEEARELMGVLKSDVPAWQAQQAVPESVMRALHTLTGSARMSGYTALGDMAQGFEKRLNKLAPGAANRALLRAELMATLPVFEQAIEAFELMIPQPAAREPEPPPPSDMGAVLEPQLVAVPVIEMPAVEVEDPFVRALADEGAITGSSLDDGLTDVFSASLAHDAPAIPQPPKHILQALPSLIEGMEQYSDDASGSALDASVLREAMRTASTAQLAAQHTGEAIDPELANIFIAEASEILETMETALADWKRDAGDVSAVGELQRALHTLKGGARMTGFMPMGDVSHDMETRVGDILLRGTAPTAADHAGLKAELETLERMHDALARGHYAETVRVAEPVPQLFTSGAGDSETDYDAPRPERPVVVATAVVMPEGWEPDLFWKPAQDAAAAMRRELARVPVESLDTMLNEAGEISIYRSRLEQQNAVLVAQLTEMRQTVVRLREQLRLMDIETDAQIAARGFNAQGAGNEDDRYGLDFDPLEMDRYSRMQELSRALAEAVGDLSSLHLTMDQGVNEAQALLLQQGRINATVQQGLMSTLMVPFSRQVARLQRVVRQTAQEEGKSADVRFEGVESELDRNVLERMTTPLEHLLRNAVVHGLEDPQGRQAGQKPPMGTVTVSLKREGTQLVMDVADDGRGLNFAAIRTKAIEQGLLPIGADLADDEIARFIFEAGFSTAVTLTQSAGRGVGMDVVASEVKQLGGSLELRSQIGQGTRFTIRLPLSLALSQALMVKVGDEIYALPLVAIEGIGRVPRAMAVDASGGGEAQFSYGGHDYRVRTLAELIDLPHVVPEDSRTVPAVLVRLGEGIAGGERRAALIVDQLIGNREVVSKAVGPQLSSISGVSGATILPSGEVVLILDPAALVVDRARRRLIAEAAASRAALERQATQGGRLIMVVDDSVTMRRVAERLLQRHGYRVITAKDGLDAIAQLQNEAPAAILLDIEMPRADGFEVAGFVRNHERIKETPIIMITSRSGDKHRTRAAALGVNRYLIKPYQEEQLLHELRALLQAREAENT